MHAVHASRIRARVLARAGQKIGPPGVEAVGQFAVVLWPQRRHRGQGHGHRILHRIVAVDFIDQRRIQILVAQLRQSQHALSQLQIAVQGGKVGVHVLDQLPVNAHRNVIAEERRLQGRIEVVHVAIEDVGLELCRQHRAGGPFKCLQRAEESLEDLHPVGPVARGARARIPRRIQPDLLSGRELDRRVGQVGVLEHAIHRAGRDAQLAGHGDDALLPGGKGVRFPAQHVLQIEGPLAQPLLLRERRPDGGLGQG